MIYTPNFIKVVWQLVSQIDLLKALATQSPNPSRSSNKLGHFRLVLGKRYTKASHGSWTFNMTSILACKCQKDEIASTTARPVYKVVMRIVFAMILVPFCLVATNHLSLIT